MALRELLFTIVTGWVLEPVRPLGIEAAKTGLGVCLFGNKLARRSFASHSEANLISRLRGHKWEDLPAEEFRYALAGGEVNEAPGHADVSIKLNAFACEGGKLACEGIAVLP